MDAGGTPAFPGEAQDVRLNVRCAAYRCGARSEVGGVKCIAGCLTGCGNGPVEWDADRDREFRRERHRSSSRSEPRRRRRMGTPERLNRQALEAHSPSSGYPSCTRSDNTGGSRTRCAGCWTWHSAKTNAGLAGTLPGRSGEPAAVGAQPPAPGTDLRRGREKSASRSRLGSFLSGGNPQCFDAFVLVVEPRGCVHADNF